MSDSLARQRCYNHGLREAAARCPECGRFYCRECVTEHEDRVLCAACLAKFAKTRARGRAALPALGRVFLVVFGVFTLWLFFYIMGRGLLLLPSAFHENTMWRDGF